MEGDEKVRIAAELATSGYARIPGVLDSGRIEAMHAACDRVLAKAPSAHLEANRTTGSMLSVAQDEWFAELIALPRTLALLRGLGLGQVVWSVGYVISKPPGGPQLFWHQDWMWWNHPVVRDPLPHQLFAMFYAVDTDRSNGCLRVVPGSHRMRMSAHDRLATAHSKAALAGESDAAMFGNLEGEIDVAVNAGDLLLGDSRLLHAAHANESSAARSLVTLWYHPAYDKLPPGIQAHFAADTADCLAHWSPQARDRIDVALPYSVGSVKPLSICRVPHPS